MFSLARIAQCCLIVLETHLIMLDENYLLFDVMLMLMFLLNVMFLLTDVRTVVNKNYRRLENLNEDLQLL